MRGCWKETARCGRIGDWRRRLAAGHLAAGAEKTEGEAEWVRRRRSEEGRRWVGWGGVGGGYVGDKSLESRLLKMQGDKRVKKPVIALKIRRQSITLDFTRPAGNKRAVIYEPGVKE